MNIQKKYFSNFIWRFLERWGAQGVSLIVTVILARLIEPEAFGILAIVTVFTSLFSVFIESGICTALVQKSDADEKDFSSVFYTNLLLCLFLYGVLFAGSPVIAAIYDFPELTAYLRVSGIVVIVAGVKSILVTFVTKKLLFKKFFFATLGGTIGAAVIGIWMAYSGFGVWALIAQNLFNNVVDTLILFITVKWRPICYFSILRVKSLLKFGMEILVYSLMMKGYSDLQQLLIGKFYTTESLAYYNKGNKFPKTIHDNTDTAMGNVLYSVMCAEQKDNIKLKNIVKKINLMSCFVVSPIVIGLAACAKPLITILLTEKWLPCVEYMQIFCVTYSMGAIYISNENAIKAKGKGNVLIKIQVKSVIICMCILLGALFVSVKAVALSSIVCVVIQHILVCAPNKELIDYPYLSQIKDILPNLLLTGVLGVVVWSVTLLSFNPCLTLGIQIILGIFLYLFGGKVFRLEGLEYALEFLKMYRCK
jgi:O-antigen/teichoic acid export membrane protein